MPRASRTIASAAAIGLCAVVVAGCGGGSGGGDGSPQSKQFASLGCASCHTLAAAGATGRTGPDLDKLKPSAAAVDRQLHTGGGVMPSFEGKLSDSEIRRLADWVARASASGS